MDIKTINKYEDVQENDITNKQQSEITIATIFFHVTRIEKVRYP